MFLFEETIGEILEKETKNHPERDFLVYPDRDFRLSYGEFNLRADNLAK